MTYAIKIILLVDAGRCIANHEMTILTLNDVYSASL